MAGFPKKKATGGKVTETGKQNTKKVAPKKGAAKKGAC